MGNYGDININRGETALLAYYAGCLSEKHTGICSFVAGISVGKMVADVTKGCRTEQCVRQCVEGYVSIAVTEKSECMGYIHAA